MYMRLNSDIAHMLSYGVHIGHSLDNMLLSSSWMVYLIRLFFGIINLLKTFISFKKMIPIIKNILAKQLSLWFINLQAHVNKYVSFAAGSCGEFVAPAPWKKGAISNFRETNKTFSLIYQKADQILSSRDKKHLLFLQDWKMTRGSWPRCVFISNVHSSYAAAVEALSAGIAAIGVVDTDTWTHVVNLPIPGNDESLLSVLFYNELVANFVLLSKFLSVVSWYVNLRVRARVMGFWEWMLRSYAEMSQRKVSIYDITEYMCDRSGVKSKSLSLAFVLNRKLLKVYQKLDFVWFDVNVSKVFFSEKVQQVETLKRTLLRLLKLYFAKFLLKCNLIGKLRSFFSKYSKIVFLKPRFFFVKFKNFSYINPRARRQFRFNNIRQLSKYFLFYFLIDYHVV